MSENIIKPRLVEKSNPKINQSLENIAVPQKVLNISAKAADSFESGNKTEALKEMDSLVTTVAEDFRAHDAPLPPAVEKTLKNTIHEAVNKAGTKTMEKLFSPDMQKELDAYRKQVSDIEKTYNFPQDAPEFYDAAGKLRNDKVMLTLGLFGITSSFNILRIKKIAELAAKFKGADTWYKKLSSAMVLGRESLPYVYTLGLIPPIVRDVKVNKKFEDSVLKLRSSVNKRVAQSLFMRDFEFIHDKPASEIMNIIDKGKQSTIELMRLTYKNIIPNIATLGSIYGTEALIAPPAGILAFLRIPMLARHSEQSARTILHERAENLERKDLIDARVLSSLQSLEVVRTTDSMVTAMDELQQNMAKSDVVEQGALKKQGERDVKHSRIDLAYTFAIPVVSAGWDALMHRKDFLSKNEEAMAFAGSSATLAGLTAWALESGNSGLVEDLVHTYTDKIQPALQDIRRMDELLGPYNTLDNPEGPREKARLSVQDVANFDISVHNLNFKNILHNVSLDIQQGSFVTIKGPSGIGKTTFLRHMLGLFGAEQGVVNYGGHDIGSIKKYGEQSIYAKLAYANQNPQYFENMTLRENLLLWTKKEIDSEKLTSVLHDLHLDHIVDRMDSKVKHFSGGELRRIGIARALLKDPKVLFLDEPTANLDQESAKQVLEIIKGMRKTRPDMTVVAVTHDANFEKIAEQIVDFRNINQPTEGDKEPLGDRQVFYANSKTNTVQ